MVSSKELETVELRHAAFACDFWPSAAIRLPKICVSGGDNTAQLLPVRRNIEKLAHLNRDRCFHVSAAVCRKNQHIRVGYTEHSFFGAKGNSHRRKTKFHHETVRVFTH